MSKSKGNGIDPIKVIEKYGADAVRLSLVVGTSPGNKIPIGDGKIKGYRNFVNKLWNATRFVQMQSDGVDPDYTPRSIADHWIAARFRHFIEHVTKDLEAYQISAAGDKMYHFVWDELCDWYIEASKADPSPAFAKALMLETLKAIHPLCPYVTEACFKALGKRVSTLTETGYPTVEAFAPDEKMEAQFHHAKAVATRIRQFRAEKGLNPKEQIMVAGENLAAIADLLMVLSRTAVGTRADFSRPTAVITEFGELVFDVPFDPQKEKTRLEKELAAAEQKLAGLTKRMANKAYMDKAPAHLVAQTQAEFSDVGTLLKSLKRQLSELDG